ncbi:hypothetical protein BKA70DRAFT_1229920 [Coprinopsis sp. MPI-PUGE-AT-0042]|nr:hypothetical protein BKA70DRAFT_1229920 [Coprinopsis sp. MPI-PUGE-AT-0042]
MEANSSEDFHLLKIPLTTAMYLSILESLMSLQPSMNSTIATEAEANVRGCSPAIRPAFRIVQADTDARDRDASGGVAPSCLHSSDTGCQEPTCSFTRIGSSNGSLSLSFQMPNVHSAAAYPTPGSFGALFHSFAFILTGGSDVTTAWKPCLSFPVRLRGSTFAGCGAAQCFCHIIPAYAADPQGQVCWLVNRYARLADSLRSSHGHCIRRTVDDASLSLYPVLLTASGDNPQRRPSLGSIPTLCLLNSYSEPMHILN